VHRISSYLIQFIIIIIIIIVVVVVVVVIINPLKDSDIMTENICQQSL